jgi:hypothetical protein
MIALAIGPGVAQATPQFRLNGVLVGPNKQNVVQFGTITMHSPVFGEIKCNVLAGAPVGNESEKGVAPVETWEAQGCHIPECTGGGFVTTESPLLLVEHEKKFEAKRAYPPNPTGRPNLPWPAQLSTPEAGRTALALSNVNLLLVCPREGLEVAYKGTLQPHVINGAKTGLKPSHLEFEGEGGKTGQLVTTSVCGGECTNADLSVSGELLMVGGGQQLVTAE